MCSRFDCAWNWVGICCPEFPDVYDDESFESDDCVGFYPDEDYDSIIVK